MILLKAFLTACAIVAVIAAVIFGLRVMWVTVEASFGGEWAWASVWVVVAVSILTGIWYSIYRDAAGK